MDIVLVIFFAHVFDQQVINTLYMQYDLHLIFPSSIFLIEFFS